MRIHNTTTAQAFVQSWLNPEHSNGYKPSAEANARRFHDAADEQSRIARAYDHDGHAENAQGHHDASIALRIAALTLVPAPSSVEVEALIMRVVDDNAPHAVDDYMIEHKCRKAGIEEAIFYATFASLKERGVIATMNQYVYRKG